MFSNENQIAEFRGSIYQDGFGFDVEVYKNEDDTLRVSSNNLLENEYNNFDDFLKDLIAKNPLWFTYYFVRIIPKYKDLIKAKLCESYKRVFDWISLSSCITQSNWHFDTVGLGNYSQNKIKEILNEYKVPPFLSNNIAEAEPVEEKRNLEQMWNGYCPESWLKGKKVRMRLNQNDFYESEATGLQIAVLPGVQAIIMNFRGNGTFRSTVSYADEIENGEILSPQNTDRPPFNNPTDVFESSDQIEKYIKNIK